MQAFYEVIQATQADLVRSHFPGYRPYKPVRTATCSYTTFDTPHTVLQWGWSTFCADGYAWTFTVAEPRMRLAHYEAIWQAQRSLWDAVPEAVTTVFSRLLWVMHGARTSYGAFCNPSTRAIAL